jgi:hypothetical protein
MTTNRLPVFLTVDAEVWPYKPGWPEIRLEDGDRNLARQFEHCILGRTDGGEFGVRYQTAMLNRHGLRATYFVEPLYSAAVGDRWLCETVGMIRAAGHDVQIHAHTEWLSDADDPELPRSYRQFIHQYAVDDQTRIVAWARRRLEHCGARGLRAFRAGSFGANRDTLRALHRAGVPIDASANRCYAGVTCLLEAPDQPAEIGGIAEFPMTVFRDYPGHLRPAQLVACSTHEMERALWQARDYAWRAFVILWHGSELLHPGLENGRPSRPSAVAVRRFEWLCHFLGKHRDSFETLSFAEIDPRTYVAEDARPELTSNVLLTAHRMAEQMIGRFV